MDATRLVVVGNGMAGMSCLDRILQYQPGFAVTVLSEEPHCNYNRILLSSVLAGEKTLEEIYINTPEWYDQNRIDLRLGVKAVDVDAAGRTVTAATGETIPYDKLLLATGSVPFIPPIEGINLDGVFVFRNLADVQALLERCRQRGHAVVIGGGLLGLEAARGLLNQGMKVTVVHLTDRLMDVQLDVAGGAFLQRTIERLGIDVRLNHKTTKLLGDRRVDGVMFEGGSILPCDLVVIACGIRPSVELARRAGLQINRGIVVNDHLETSDPNIFAVGECVEHRGKVYGLVAPLYDQGKVLAATITGHKGPGYEGSTLAAKLKIIGVDVFSAGEVQVTGPECEVAAYQDEGTGVYQKLVFRRNRLVGTILVGDVGRANRLLELIRRQEPVGEQRYRLLFDTAEAKLGAAEDVMSRADEEMICGCVGVTKGRIIEAIRGQGLKSLAGVKTCTKASTGCGTCTQLVEGILRAVVGDQVEEKKNHLCACVPFPKAQLRTMIQTQRLKSVQDILDIYGNGAGCGFCKPALSFLVDEVWLGEHHEDRSARFINDRVHANIQNDGTFSVVPRMPGGVTSAEQLRKIADAADKYQVRMVKVTGSQRLDLLGVKKEDLPKIWADLGMRSGHAYTKAVRMVKSCVGTDFCRYGTQNSITTGIKLEELLEGLYTPAKVKMGVVGCPRNCAEATVKDIGLVGFEGGWQVVIGGAAGKRVRAADILATVPTTEEALEAALLFFQYYRERGEYPERTYDFVERVGLETIRRETVLASPEKKQALLDRLAKAKTKTVNPWDTESKQPVHPMQFTDFVLPKDAEALRNQPAAPAGG
ncbi:MAG: NAD(P)/FAD-dependent oxidoreductase [Candidatus Omnitrophica bacterium]|nr:NAD(P)/FAD-dependent oxidoreductase [Candidatus Omnitrophota bacterium]